jgi:hypothetical protein
MRGTFYSVSFSHFIRKKINFINQNEIGQLTTKKVVGITPKPRFCSCDSHEWIAEEHLEEEVTKSQILLESD